MLTSAQHLEAVTRVYWDVSSIYRGRLAIEMTTGEAIGAMNTIEEQTGPTRLLKRRAFALSEAIVVGGRRKKSKTVATVVSIKR